jgi:Polyketide cyclase / dehydrase and lipid transport
LYPFLPKGKQPCIKKQKMKIFRQLFFFLIALLIATAGLSLFMPTSQKLNRSITINAPAAVIFEKVKKLDNFNRFSVWSQQDSTAKFTMTGTDGTVGATLSWKGDPAISGEGKIEIISLEAPYKVAYTLHFTTPKEGNAESVFSIIEKEKGITTISWYFDLATPRPWNIFNLFYSLDKEMGKDFETGLAALKLYIETGNFTN